MAAEKQQIDKNKRIKEIDERIKQISAYMQAADPGAQSRVAALDKNPCMSGLYYLNGVYKVPSTIMVTPAPMSKRQTIEKRYGYDDFKIEGYVVENNGLFTKDHITGPFNSISQLNSEITRLNSLKKELHDDYQVYINLDGLYAHVSGLMTEELNTDIKSKIAVKKTEIKKITDSGLNDTTDIQNEDDILDLESDIQSMPQQMVYDLSLNSIYNGCYEDTIKILKTVDNPSYLENGIPGIIKTSKLLEWGNFKKTIDIQNQIIEKNEINGEFPYLTGWIFNITYGPDKSEKTFNFQNFMKNEFKPIVEQRLKVIEDGEDKNYGVMGLSGTFPCKKYFKTWISQLDLDKKVEALLNVQRNDKEQAKQILAEIKKLYLSKKGIWIKDENDPAKAIPMNVRWCPNY